MTIKPLFDRILISPIAKKEVVKTSGIILPEAAADTEDNLYRGEVVATGPGKTTADGTLIPVVVKVGDTVMFSKFGYDVVSYDGNSYLLMPESIVLAVIEN